MMSLEEKLSYSFFSKWENRKAVNVIFAEHSFRLHHKQSGDKPASFGGRDGQVQHKVALEFCVI